MKLTCSILGFENVYNLNGGILNWHYDVIKGIPEERPELITGNENVGDILMLALKLEKGALDFYSKAQEKVRDKKDFTGDGLFVGDVGRTDLYGPVEASRLAGALYDSIINKILPLGDGVILCPAHGAGSVRGGKVSARDESTIGIERTQNPMLQQSKEDFIEHKVSEHHERPPYFQRMEKYNLEGPPLLGRLPIPPPLTPEIFKEEMERGMVVVDARTPSAFGGAHINGSYSIWLESLPAYAGWVLTYEKPILLVLD